MRSRWGEITKDGDHSAEGHCSPDRGRLVAGFRSVVGRMGRSTRASCGNSLARTELTDLLHLHPSPNALGWRTTPLMFVIMLEVQVSDSVLTDDARAANRQANINGAKSAPQDCRVGRPLAIRSVFFLCIRGRDSAISHPTCGMQDANRMRSATN